MTALSLKCASLRATTLLGTLFSAFFSQGCEPALATPCDDLQKLFGGIASWYGGKFHGRRTASGTIYNMHQMTCAHKTLPFGTKLLVFNPQNGKKVEVVVTDRGPYVGHRVVDLSKAAADKLNIQGIGNVVCYVGRKVLSEVAETIQIKQGSHERRNAMALAANSAAAKNSASEKTLALEKAPTSEKASTLDKTPLNELIAARPENKLESKIELHPELVLHNTEEADQYQMVLVSAALNHVTRASAIQTAMAETVDQENTGEQQAEYSAAMQMPANSLAPDAFAANGNLERISSQSDEANAI